jgi:uncharacterized membrane protein
MRAGFQEGLWARWNLVRAIASAGAFACVAWVLVLYGRIAG